MLALVPLRPTARRSWRDAFTLLELIVVLIVLGIIAALAVPTFDTVKTNSRDQALIASMEAWGRAAGATAASGMGTEVTLDHLEASAPGAEEGTAASSGEAPYTPVVSDPLADPEDHVTLHVTQGTVMYALSRVPHRGGDWRLVGTITTSSADFTITDGLDTESDNVEGDIAELAPPVGGASGSTDDGAVEPVTVAWDGQFEGHDHYVYDVAISPDGQTIYSASHDHTVRAIDAGTGAEDWRYEGHTGSVYGVAVSPDGQTVYSASNDAAVRAIDAGTGAEDWRFDGHAGSVRSVAASPDGEVVYSASQDRTVRAIDAATGIAVWDLDN